MRYRFDLPAKEAFEAWLKLALGEDAVDVWNVVQNLLTVNFPDWSNVIEVVETSLSLRTNVIVNFDEDDIKLIWHDPKIEDRWATVTVPHGARISKMVGCEMETATISPYRFLVDTFNLTKEGQVVDCIEATFKSYPWVDAIFSIQLDIIEGVFRIDESNDLRFDHTGEWRFLSETTVNDSEREEECGRRFQQRGVW